MHGEFGRAVFDRGEPEKTDDRGAGKPQHGGRAKPDVNVHKVLSKREFKFQ